MDIDLIFVLGVIVGAFVIPAFFSAYSDRRWPKMAALMVAISAGMIGYAVRQNPDVYTLANIDDIIVDVVGRYIN